MLMTIIIYSFIVYVIYRLFHFWIIRPWSIQRELSQQGIPGQYIPIFGDIWLRRRAYLAGKPFSYVEEANVKYGDYYHTSFGPFPCLSISDPALIENVLKSNNRFYHKSELAKEILGAILGYENLILTEDAHHTQRRRLLNPVFQHQNINSMISLMVDITSRFLTKWQVKTDNQAYPLILDVSKEMSNLTLEIISGCAFGVEAMKDRHVQEVIYQNLQAAIEQIEERIYSLIIIIPIVNRLPIFGKRCIDKCRQDIKKVALRIINQRRQGLTKATCKGPDLLDLLLAAQGEGNAHKLTDEEVSNEALTFVLAGHETTATLMTWTLYNLVTNPDVYVRCQNEVDSVLNENKELTAATLSLLTYTEAVLKETLRYHQPVPVMLRTAIADNVIVASDGKQIRVRKGMDIFISLNILNSSEKYWHEPKKFNPSRFLEQHSNVMFPFGYGPRTCIGQNFAMLEARIILAMLLHAFRFELVPGQNLVPSTAVTIRFLLISMHLNNYKFVNRLF